MSRQAPLRIGFYGSSLVSSYWNGAATYYRGLLKALAGRGHRVTFFEPDAYQRQQHRDIPDPDWAEVMVWHSDRAGLEAALSRSSEFDLVVKASGVGAFDEELEAGVLQARRPGQIVAFWDVDAPATLDRVEAAPNDPFRPLIGAFDLILTYGGGARVVDGYTRLGASTCVPIYNALDPDTHFPVPPEQRFAGTLGFLGNRLPDREQRVEDFFLAAARQLPEASFLLGGSGWEDREVPANVRRLGHVGTSSHNAFNSSALAVLNINRDSMAAYGFSPPTRVFEAAGAAACLITDAWEGIEDFLEPGREILVAHDGREVASLLEGLDPERARRIGAAARERILARHTYAHRALQVEATLEGRVSVPA